MIIPILMIIVGIWMTRWAKRFEAQRRQEMFDRWELKRKICYPNSKHLGLLLDIIYLEIFIPKGESKIFFSRNKCEIFFLRCSWIFFPVC